MGALGVHGEISTSLIRFSNDIDMNEKEIDFALYKIGATWVSPFLIEDYDALLKILMHCIFVWPGWLQC